jgi:hypothetical protein
LKGILEEVRKRCLTLLIFFFLLGCEKHSQLQPECASTTEHIASINYSDAKNAQALAKDNFIAGEVPAIRIQGCGGRMVRFLLYETSTSKLITGKNHYIAKGRTLYWPFPHLSEGSYYFVLKTTGIRETCTFTVSR